MNSVHKVASLALPIALAAGAIAGGIAGAHIQASNLAYLGTQNQIARFGIDADAQREYAAGTEAASARAAFQPALDAATALIASSDGKASAESRASLQSLLDQYASAVGTTALTGREDRLIAQSASGTAAPAIAAASQRVTDEVAAWQAAEDARVAAEAAAAAEQAAREAAASRSHSGSGSTSTRSGSDSSDSGSGSGGGSSAPSDGRAWAEGIARSVAGWDVPISWGFQGPGKYAGITYSGSSIQFSDAVGNGSGYGAVVAAHEGAHVRQRGACSAVWRGHFGGDGERFAQAWTASHGYGTVQAYAYPTQADLDAASTC